MNEAFKLDNPIMNYEWGSHSSLSRIIGRPFPAMKPEAEMWMGTHPTASSLIEYNKKKFSLYSHIKSHPEKMLGIKTIERFGYELPFLFKLLVANKPLSIQAHPDKTGAEDGFKRENSMNIPMDAPNRNYKDRSHKPECMVALTPFCMLYGFRSPLDIRFLLETYELPFPESFRKILESGTSVNVLKEMFIRLMSLSTSVKERLLADMVEHLKKMADDHMIFEWILKLYRLYPEDIGTLSPIFLNLFILNPGEAVFVPSGILHSYLSGIGMEIMANSDNVLRGGLTSKHIDLNELISILNFTPNDLKPYHPKIISRNEERYDSPSEEFVLSHLILKDGMIFEAKSREYPEIIFCLDGEAIFWGRKKSQISIKRGDSFFIPACTSSYSLKGDASIYRASVNAEILGKAMPH